MNAAADSTRKRSAEQADAGPLSDRKSAADLGAADHRNAPLGNPTGHPDRYAPDLLFTVPSKPQRDALGIG